MKRFAMILVLAALCWGAVAVLSWACSPPEGGINGVKDGSTVSGTVKLEVAVTSETEVKGVDLYADDGLAASLEESPYVYELDTATLADGEHTVYAKVRALKRADGKSDTLTFTVKNQKEAAGSGSASTG